jgi:capsular polysaccharide biosynthesis protein
MELKQYFKIFGKNLVWFLIVLLLTVAIGAGYKHYKNSRPESYQVSLLLNITRNGIQTTDNYRYDNFYRLQADERFADTVVKWIKNPRIVTNVYNETGMISGGIDLDALSGFFNARRLSSQAIEVSFIAQSAVEAQNLSENLVKTLNSESKSLNQFQKEDSWFKIIGDEPVIKEYKITWKSVLQISTITKLY